MVRSKVRILNAGEIVLLYKEKVISKEEALERLGTRKFNAGELVLLMKEGLLSKDGVREKLGFKTEEVQF